MERPMKIFHLLLYCQNRIRKVPPRGTRSRIYFPAHAQRQSQAGSCPPFVLGKGREINKVGIVGCVRLRADGRRTVGLYRLRVEIRIDDSGTVILLGRRNSAVVHAKLETVSSERPTRGID